MSVWNNGTQAAQVFVQGYWLSFIRSFDPNKHVKSFWTEDGEKLTSPKWDTFGKDGNETRLLFDNRNVVKMEEVSDRELERCKVVNGMGLQLKQ
jgi:hypothetical protein